MPDFVLPIAEPALLGDFNSPDREWGGADPRSYESGDGTWFHGALEKDAAGALRLVVWHTTANGAVLGKWAESGIVGQGGLVLQGNGRLDAVGYIAQGDNATRRTIPVPDWKPWPVQQGARGPQGIPGPKGDKGDPGPQGPPGDGSGGGGAWEAVRQALKAWLLG